MGKNGKLSKGAETIRRRLVKEYEITDEGGLLILQTGLEAYERMQSARKQIEAQGMVLQDRWGQTKPHPLLTTERDARAQWLAALKQLNLDLEPLRDKGR